MPEASIVSHLEEFRKQLDITREKQRRKEFAESRQKARKEDERVAQDIINSLIGRFEEAIKGGLDYVEFELDSSLVKLDHPCFYDLRGWVRFVSGWAEKQGLRVGIRTLQLVDPDETVKYLLVLALPKETVEET